MEFFGFLGADTLTMASFKLHMTHPVTHKIPENLTTCSHEPIQARSRIHLHVNTWDREQLYLIFQKVFIINITLITISVIIIETSLNKELQM